MSEDFDRTFWEERYRGHTASPAGRPSPHLVAAVADVTPGTALDAGCGEGADAGWLASRGWRVTAVDISANAVCRARAYAATLDADVRDRIEWVRADLTTWEPTSDFDLVTTHYVHTAERPRALVERLAAVVASRGTLLVVGHDPSDRHAAAHAHGTHVTAEEIAAGLDPDAWEILVAEVRERGITRPDGREVMLGDAVLRARKRHRPDTGRNSEASRPVGI